MKQWNEDSLPARIGDISDLYNQESQARMFSPKFLMVTILVLSVLAAGASPVLAGRKHTGKSVQTAPNSAAEEDAGKSVRAETQPAATKTSAESTTTTPAISNHDVGSASPIPGASMRKEAQKKPQRKAAGEESGGHSNAKSDEFWNPLWIISSILVTNFILLVLMILEVVVGRRRRDNLVDVLDAGFGKVEVQLSDVARLLRDILRSLRDYPNIPRQPDAATRNSDPTKRPEGEGDDLFARRDTDLEAVSKNTNEPPKETTADIQGRELEGDAWSLVNSYCSDHTMRSIDLIRKVHELGLKAAVPGPFSNRNAWNHEEGDPARLLAIQERHDGYRYLVVLRDEVAPDLKFWSDLFEIPKEAKIGGAKVRCATPAVFDGKTGNVLSRGIVEVVHTYDLPTSASIPLS